MSDLLEILGLPHYAYLVVAIILATVAALTPKRFALRVLIVGSVALGIGGLVLLYLFSGGTVFRLPADVAAVYFARAGLFGGGLLAGLLARRCMVAFFLRLASLSSPKGHKRAPGSGNAIPKNDILEGVAFACLLSILCGIVLVKRPLNAAIFY